MASFLNLSIIPSIKAETCIASIYSSKDRGGKIGAGGAHLNDNALTAAHKSFSLGSKHRVTHNGHSITVTINDRGPYAKGRCLDLRPAAARAINCDGLCRVSVD